MPVTLFQFIQIFLIIISFIIQYYWFYEHTSPYELMTTIMNAFNIKYDSRNINDNEKFDSRDNATNDDDNKSEIKTKYKSNIKNMLLSDLMVNDLEKTYQYFEYSQYKSKESVYLQFWMLFFESLSNNYYFQTKNPENKQLFMSKDEMIETDVFRNNVYQKECLFISTQNIFNKYKPNGIDSGTKYVNGLFNLGSIMNEIDKNSLYESPYINWINKKIKKLDNNKNKNNIMTQEYVLNRLNKETMVINNAGLMFKSIAFLERILMKTLYIPINTNVYVSGLRDNKIEFSSKIHSDRQDIFIIQTQGYKRWQIWEPIIKNPRFEQIRGKDEDIVYDSELVNSELLIDAVLYPGDILYIPRGYLHQVTMINDNTTELDTINAYSIHLSIGLELDTLGFNIESFMFCSMGIAYKDIFKTMEFQDDGEKFQTMTEQKQSLTYISIWLWKWTFMNTDSRDVFPFFSFSYIQNNMDQTRYNNTYKKQQFNQFYDKILNLILEFKNMYSATDDVEQSMKDIIPNVSIDHIKTAHTIFYDSMDKLMKLFMSKESFINADEYSDVVDRQEKYEEMMVEYIVNTYEKCGVPVDLKKET